MRRTQVTVTAMLPPWLAALPTVDGMIAISDARRYAHEEAAYDAQYQNDAANLQVGRGLMKLVADAHGDVSAPALEVGCGTGLLSMGLLAESTYPLTILTDPSTVFLEITRAKAQSSGLSMDRACLAILRAEDIDRLPSRSLSLIALRSTLHHVLDPDAFITHAGRALVPGGILAFQEPCMEGFILMGAMMQFLPTLADAAGVRVTDAQRAKLDLFPAAMTFYARRDVDKSAAEDKHLFRVDEVQRCGFRAGLDVRFHPNTSFDAAAADRPPGQRPFLKFMRDYAKYCMSWDDSLMALFDRFMPPYCTMVQTASGGGSGPYFDGVFIARKVS
jgi:SAM-dependent methyltransferase